MKRTRTLSVGAVALGASLVAIPDAHAECSVWGAAETRGNLERLDLDEASGLARAWTGDDALWSHNDSGDDPRLYAIGADGSDLGVWDVDGATARDWEDITRGPCGARECLYIADFGNNSESRDDLVIWRVAEPERPAAPLTERGLTAPAVGFSLTYDFDDGANPDAESLWYDHRDGALYMATKEDDTTRVLRVTLDDVTGVAELELIGEVPISSATAGAATLDGDTFVIRNYFAGFSYSRANGESVADALAAGGTQIRLTNEGQAEALAFNSTGDGIWTVSEDEGPPLRFYPCADEVNTGADAGPDAGADAGSDAGAGADAGPIADAGSDAGPKGVDAGEPDAGGSNGADTGAGASPVNSGSDGGCVTSPGPAPAAPWWAALMAGVWALGVRRRRRA